MNELHEKRLRQLEGLNDLLMEMAEQFYEAITSKEPGSDAPMDLSLVQRGRAASTLIRQVRDLWEMESSEFRRVETNAEQGRTSGDDPAVVEEEIRQLSAILEKLSDEPGERSNP